MTSIYSRNWMAYGLLIGFWAACGYGESEAQSAKRDIRTQSFRQGAAPPAGESTPPPPLVASGERSSVSLSPAVAIVKCKLGQSYTQTLTLTNGTAQELAFEMIAEDVVVRDGKRAFVAAGETANGIAATAVFTQREVVVAPQQSSSVGVTFTVPQETTLRAVAAVFRGSSEIPGRGGVQMTASLGALFTFTVLPNFTVESAPLAVTAQSATANLGFSQLLANTGSEPVIAGGVAVVLDQAGAIVGKAAFEPHRLLPGERMPFRTEYSTELKPGHYRVLASFQYEEKVITSSVDFTVP